MIKVENLHKSFSDIEILKGIDIDVKKGEVIVIIGPSGSGKSTLLRCLNFLEYPNEGIISLGDTTVNVKNMTKKDIYNIRKHSAMVFQSYNLFKNKTVLENVIEAMLVVKKVNIKEARDVGKQLLAQVGLSDKCNSYPSVLSGGQQQRVSIARAMAVNPEVILFDEPTSALDPELVGEVLNVIRGLAQKHMTMIIVTHEMSFAREIADRIIFMDEGNILEQGKPIDIFTNPEKERTKKFLKKIIDK